MGLSPIISPPATAEFGVENYSHPDIMVVMAKRPQFLPPDGSAMRAANSGNSQNSPKKQWRVRSPKYSLL